VTPNPTIVITPPPEQRPTITGTILFSRTGNIWAASGLDLTSVATAGTDSSPAWSPDGSTIYAIQTTDKPNQDPPFDAAKYFLRVTNIVSMNADGSNRKQVFKGQFSQNGGTWFTGVYQPDVSPDGNRFALVSDLGYVPVNGCESCYQPIVLSTMSTDGTKLTNLKVRYDNDLGHNDPDWSPDGKEIAFTYNSRGGTDGAPRIGILTVSTGSLNLLRKGYANPSWSRDGTMIAAERTTSSGRDIVVLDPRSGSELARLTNDGDSFRPEFSPNGDQIAFLHRKGLGVDLQIMTISQSGGGITLLETKPVTDDGSLDATSSPAWFIPADQITSPPAGPAASAAP
jgi:Tol biopolymer transport system component